MRLLGLFKLIVMKIIHKIVEIYWIFGHFLQVFLTFENLPQDHGSQDPYVFWTLPSSLNSNPLN